MTPPAQRELAFPPKMTPRQLAGAEKLAHKKPLISLPGERWRTISLFPDYAVSDHGRVKRTTPNSYGCGYEMKPTLGATKGSYRRVTVGLTHALKRRTCLIHQLVCEAFHGPRPAGCTDVRHLDGNSLNNHYTNLCWGTRAENVADSRRHGTIAAGEKNGHAKLTEADVAKIRKNCHSWTEAAAMAPQFHVSATAVYDIVTGRRWRTLAGVSA